MNLTIATFVCFFLFQLSGVCGRQTGYPDPSSVKDLQSTVRNSASRYFLGFALATESQSHTIPFQINKQDGV